MSGADRSVAGAIVEAAVLISERLGGGGRLIVHGSGRCAFDAQHVAVEFLHPVITGKPALASMVAPAVTDTGDVTLAIGYGGSPAAAGCDITIADHEVGGSTIHIPLPGDAESSAKGSAVVAYHVLWEVVHVFFETRPNASSQPESLVQDLYPMLYDRPPDDRLDEALASAESKLAASVLVVERARERNREAIERASEALAGPPTVFTCGNGGSATDAADVAHAIGPRGRCLSTDMATVTALANDVSIDVAFARPLRTLGRPGDALIGLSTSGRSSNVLSALSEAIALKMTTVGFAGYGGGPMAELDLDALLVVESDSVHRIQEAQVALYGDVVERARAAG